MSRIYRYRQGLAAPIEPGNLFGCLTSPFNRSFIDSTDSSPRKSLKFRVGRNRAHGVSSFRFPLRPREPLSLNDRARLHCCVNPWSLNGSVGMAFEKNRNGKYPTCVPSLVSRSMRPATPDTFRRYSSRASILALLCLRVHVALPEIRIVGLRSRGFSRLFPNQRS